MYVIAIDPGLTATGIAVFCGEQVENVLTLRPPKRLVTASLDRYRYLWGACCIEVTKYGRSLAGGAVEFVQKQGGRKGRAALESGDLFKLSLLAGGYLAILDQYSWGSLEAPTPSAWKGNLSKELIEKRAKRRTDLELNEHTAHAVMLGHWWLKRHRQEAG